MTSSEEPSISVRLRCGRCSFPNSSKEFAISVSLGATSPDVRAVLGTAASGKQTASACTITQPTKTSFHN